MNKNTRTLVIVESPAKCKTIESYLGPGYKVIASFGHLRNIVSLTDINIENNFETNYSLIQEPLKLKQVDKIREEISNSNDVIIATDNDREGEAIGWHICELFGLSVTDTKRIIFQEITEPAIQSAIAYPKRLDMNLIRAQQARQILDLLVGFTISPILWNSISKKYDSSLSAGRCQTPALRLVYENYLEIKNSQSRMVYNVSGYFTNHNLLFALNKQFETKEETKLFLEECKGWKYVCSVSSPKKSIRKPPEPLTTSSLQQCASNELHMSPKETMKCAQQLYEHGYITYMRTDSKKYSAEFIKKAKDYIMTTYGSEFVSSAIDNISDNNTESNTKIKSKTKSNVPPPQEAHEAIRPVNISVKTPSETSLDKKALKLYTLIWETTLESCMTSAQFNVITATISAPLDTQFVYKTEQPIFMGWQIVPKASSSSALSSNSYNYLISLKANIISLPKKIEAKQTQTDVKGHLTEARLVQMLEEKGIGRPSTFASLVDKIQERKYVIKQNIEGKEIDCVNYELVDKEIKEIVCKKEVGNEKNKLVIQPLGIIVIEFLMEHFSDFFNYGYTKTIEDKLDIIAKGDIEWFKLCSECYEELIKLTKQEGINQKYSLKIDDNNSLIIGKYGPVIKNIDKNNKISFLPVKKDFDIKTIETEDIKIEDIIDESGKQNGAIGKYKGKDLYLKKGKYGLYAQWGSERCSLKEFGNKPLAEIKYVDVLKYLEKDDLLDPEKPIGMVRELTKDISIRNGKWGDYIYYKKRGVKKPLFLKLTGFNMDYKKCDKEVLLNWITTTASEKG